MRLITRDLAEAHLRIKVALAYEEIDFLAKIEQAEALVLDYVNQRRSDGDLWAAEVEAWNITDTAAQPPPQVQAAVLVQLGELYRFRGDDQEGDQHERDSGWTLHPRAAGYLHRHRDPALA